MQKRLDYFIEYEIMNRFNSIGVQVDKGIDLSITDFNNTELVNRKIQDKKLSSIHNLLKSKIKVTSNLNDSLESIDILLRENLDVVSLKIALKKRIQINWFDYERGYEGVIDQIVSIMTDNKLLVLYPIINKKNWRYPLVVFECTIKESEYSVDQYYLHQESLASIIANLLSVSISELYESIGSDFTSFYRSLSTLKNDSIFELIHIIDQEIFSKYETDDYSSIWDMKEFSSAGLSQSVIIILESLNEAYVPPFREELELLRRTLSIKNPPELLTKYLMGNDYARQIECVMDTFHFGSYSEAYSINEKQAKVVSAYQTNSLVSVSGPPGTGKTTVLKELIADSFVKKTKRLVDCWDKEWQAFGDNESDGKPLYKTPFGGYCENSLIVTSTNNKAIENIGIELLSEIQYFKGVGNSNYIPSEHNKELEGLFCAKLGKNENMTSFRLDALLKLVKHIKEAEYEEQIAVESIESFKSIWKILDNAQNDILAYLSIRTEIIDKLIKLEVYDFSANENTLNSKLLELKQHQSNLNSELELKRKALLSVEKEISDLKYNLVKVTGLVDTTIKEKEKIALQIKLVEDTRRIPIIGKVLVKFKKLEDDYGNIINMQSRLISLEKNIETYGQLSEDDRKRLSLKINSENELKSACGELDSQLKSTNLKMSTLEALQGIRESFNKIRTYYNLECNWLDNSYLLINDLSFTKKRNQLFKLGLKINELYIIRYNKEIASNLEKIYDDNKWFKSVYNSSYVYSEKQIPKIKMLWETLFLCFPVVTTTLHSFEKSKFQMIEGLFDTILLDEAGQVLPHMVAAPLYRARRAVVVGDVFQLEPIRGNLGELIEQFTFEEEVQNQINIELSSAQHYADRGTDVYEKIANKQVGIILEEHRRCEAAIVAFSNEVVYDNKLSVVKPNSNNEVLNSNLCFIDLRGKKNKQNENHAEVEICKKLVEFYIEVYGIEVKSRIGIITPFKNQVKVLKSAIEGVAIGTVHTFQGQEKDYIILSSVIDNNKSNSGVKFVGEKPNFLNVAFTRAKKQLIVLGSYEAYLDSKNYLKASLEVIRKNGLIYSMYNPDLSAGIDQNYLQQFMRMMSTSVNSNERYDNLFTSFSMNGLIASPSNHYALLKHVIIESKESLRIVSPWITDKVLDREMLRVIKSKIDTTKYEICFGYHSSVFSLDEIDKILELDNNKSNTYVDLEILRENINELISIIGSSLIYKPPLHTKAVIIDDEFMIIGSHNWLSNSGASKEAKDEISCIVTNKDMIEYIKDRYFTSN